MKRYNIRWSKGKQQYEVTLENRAEAEELRNYIETQSTLKLLEFNELG